MRAIDTKCAINFMAVSSYGNGVKSSGIVRIIKDLDIDINGRDVLIVEDVLDSGLTLKYLMKNLASRHPASLEVCTFLEGRRGQAGRHRPQVRGHALPRRVRGGLRPGLRRALPQPALCGCAQTGGLRII